MTSPGDTGHSPERTRTSWLASVSSKFIQKDFTDFAGWVQIVAGKSPRRNDSRTDDPKVTVWRSSSAMKPAATVDNNSHQDYMPGVVLLRHDGGKNIVLCAWADTWRGRFWAKGGPIEHP
jgi:hypothetical protein